jgi:hypothetical protein
MNYSKCLLETVETAEILVIIIIIIIIIIMKSEIELSKAIPVTGTGGL